MLLAWIGAGLALAAAPTHDGLKLSDAPASWAASALARASGLELLVVGEGAPVDLVLPPGDAAQALQQIADAAGLTHVTLPAGEDSLHLLLPAEGAAALQSARLPRARDEARLVVAVSEELDAVAQALGASVDGPGGRRVTVVLRHTPPDLAATWLERALQAAPATELAPPAPLACPERDPLALIPCVPAAELSLSGLVAGPRAVALLQRGGSYLLAQDGDSLAAPESLPDRLARWQLFLREGRAALHLGSAQARSFEVGRARASLCEPAEETLVACVIQGSGEQVSLCEGQGTRSLRVGTLRSDRWSVFGLGAEGAVQVAADGTIQATAHVHRATLRPVSDGGWSYQEDQGASVSCRP